MGVKTRATVEDFYKVEGKAEFVNGEIVLMSPTGGYRVVREASLMPACCSTRDYRAMGMRSLTMLGF
jgi:hypothetical protein